MNIDLTGKLALVTGSNAGIGRAIALALASAGADVAVTYRNGREQGEETARAIREKGVRSAAFQLDAGDAERVARFPTEIEETFGRSVDVLVNNAGHLIGRVPSLEMTEAHYDKVMDVNFKSCVLMCAAFGKGMREKGGGSIINMTSVAAHNGGGAGAAVYAGAKAAMIAYSKGLAKEVAGAGIRVNLISPGFIGQTAFHDTFTPEAARKATVQGIPLGREGTPDDVAGAALFFASDLSSYITGETIEVNGGMFMR
ncbi:glucose 1-dehydrogenase [Paenibacillus sp.]|uniref:SDR family NAD(P)-dependent oxidoreductase n=1 Tax=Paenibacillus sp. TaxID=58172 RepID=UPI00281101DC|nr:glucose 1-dehydrogenase [Paenibacillus sp.]